MKRGEKEPHHCLHVEEGSHQSSALCQDAIRQLLILRTCHQLMSTNEGVGPPDTDLRDPPTPRGGHPLGPGKYIGGATSEAVQTFCLRLSRQPDRHLTRFECHPIHDQSDLLQSDTRSDPIPSNGGRNDTTLLPHPPPPPQTIRGPQAG